MMYLSSRTAIWERRGHSIKEFNCSGPRHVISLFEYVRRTYFPIFELPCMLSRSPVVAGAEYLRAIPNRKRFPEFPEFEAPPIMYLLAGLFGHPSEILTK